VLLLLAAALALALALAACGGDEGGAPVGELTIQEATASTLAGPLTVKGYIVAAEGQPIRLCTALLESYPPQCGQPFLVVEGLDLATLEGLSSTDDPSLAQVSWSDREIAFLGEVEGGVLTVSEPPS
jgi:hypothetical protein